MQNKFFGSKLNTILLLILITLVIWAISVMLKNKETYLPFVDQDSEQGNLVLDASLQESYEDTPESKIVYKSSVVYLTSYEKRGDGYYYLTFDYADWDESQPEYLPGNKINVIKNNLPQETFRAATSMKVNINYDDCENQKQELFSDYQSKLVLKDGYFWNPNNNSPDHYNGFFVMVVHNGLVTSLEEVRYGCGE